VALCKNKFLLLNDKTVKFLNGNFCVRLQSVNATSRLSAIERKMLKMKYPARIYYTETDKAMMWDR